MRMRLLESSLIPVVADEIANFAKQHVVAVQTVLYQEYWHGLTDGLIGRGTKCHVLLDAAPETMHARIDSDPGGHDIRKWRHEHVEEFMSERL